MKRKKETTARKGEKSNQSPRRLRDDEAHGITGVAMEKKNWTEEDEPEKEGELEREDGESPDED